MSWTRAISGSDLVAAFVIGGFRAARRERGLVLLVKDLDTVVVREDVVVEPRRIGAILERAHLTDEQLEGWLTAATAAEPRSAMRSGFQRRVEPGDIADAIARSRALLRRLPVKK